MPVVISDKSVSDSVASVDRQCEDGDVCGAILNGLLDAKTD